MLCLKNSSTKTYQLLIAPAFIGLIVIFHFISLTRFDIAPLSIRYLDENVHQCTKWPHPRSVAVTAVTAPRFEGDRDVPGTSRYFQMYLPFVIGSWCRLGYSSFIIVIGSSKLWLQNGTYLNHIYQTVQNDLNGFGYFHFIETNSTALMSMGKISQMIRLFAADMEPLRNLDDIYMLTTDADWLPIHDIFKLPNSDFSIRASFPPVRQFKLFDSDKIIRKFSIDIFS